MKKLLFLTLSGLIALPLVAGTTTTKTSSSVDETREAAPIMGTDLEMNSELSRDDEMIEAQEEDYFNDMEQENMEQERMEDNYYSEGSEVEEDMIDYRDRTRTNRERKAINTGSDASDDQ